MIDFKIDEVFNVTNTDYNLLKNKPKINDVEIEGELNFSDLGLIPIDTEEIENIVSEEW